MSENRVTAQKAKKKDLDVSINFPVKFKSHQEAELS